MRVALVTDWLYGGGSEQVVLELHRMFPEAPIYTSYCSDEWRAKLNNKVVTGYLQKPPFRQLRKFLPLLRQWWFASLDLSDFDLVISITGNGEAKFAKASHGKHLSYCHTPVHFYWRHYEQYLKNPGFKPVWLARLGLRFFVKPLRKRDYAAAQKVDYFIANSTHIKSDIQKFYNRESRVVFPPVDTERFSIPNPQPSTTKTGFVIHGRLVPLKRVDLAVKACSDLGLPLTVIGKGPELEKLNNIAGPSITFAGFVPDEDLPSLIASHQAYLFPSFEDFGVAPVEAMAAGLPVIAYEAGGTLDYVVPGLTGEFMKEQTAEALIEVLETFDYKNYNPEDLMEQANKFSINKFQSSISEVVRSL